MHVILHNALLDVKQFQNRIQSTSTSGQSKKVLLVMVYSTYFFFKDFTLCEVTISITKPLKNRHV